MSVLFLLLPFALFLGFGFTVAFAWMAAKGQFDDLETPALRLLLEDVPERVPQEVIEERNLRDVSNSVDSK